VAAQEQSALKVKGFAEPVRCYKVLGIYHDLVEQGIVIREERDGFRFLLDLQKHDKAGAIKTLETILSRLRT
jgi:adenylate cyclase